jgi:hypothetical protein
MDSPFDDIHGQFFYGSNNFIMQKVYFSRLMPVCVGVIMLVACTVLCPGSLLLIVQQGLVHFFRYRPLLPIGWRITTLSAIQASSNSLLLMNNETPLVISRNDKNEQLTLLIQRKLALIARNMYTSCAICTGWQR